VRPIDPSALIFHPVNGTDIARAKFSKLSKKWFASRATQSLVAQPNANSYGKICQTNFT
jgi:hypothetical protein